MRTLIAVAALMLTAVALVVPADAATWNLSWTAGSTDPSTVTVIERGPLISARCPTAVGGANGYVEIATVPSSQTTYVDNAAPAGFLCYRAKHRFAFDPADGTPVLSSDGAYSNVDATKPGAVKNIKVAPQAP